MAKFATCQAGCHRRTPLWLPAFVLTQTALAFQILQCRSAVDAEETAMATPRLPTLLRNSQRHRLCHTRSGV